MFPAAPDQAPPSRPGRGARPGPRRRARRRAPSGLFEPAQLVRSFPGALRKLHPRALVRNPVLCVVSVGAILTTLSAILHPALFTWVISVWLWLTVVFANLAEAVAEGRGKAQAESLRRARTDTVALRLLDWRWGTHADTARSEAVAATDLKPLDVVLVEAGETIPADGDVIDGVATVDKSAVTGESAPVIREAGGDRSGVTGGTTVLSDRIVVRVSARPGHSFLDRMIALVEGASRQKTPNEIALNILLASLTAIFTLVVVTLQPMAAYADAAQSTTVLVALLVTLIPTTIGALLSAIGIAGMDRLVQRNVLAMSGRAVEAAGDVNTLLLDKTGTITLGNREAVAFVALPGVDEDRLAEAAQLSSLADATPEGRSVVVLAEQAPRAAGARRGGVGERPLGAVQRPDQDERRRSALGGRQCVRHPQGRRPAGHRLGGGVRRRRAARGTAVRRRGGRRRRYTPSGGRARRERSSHPRPDPPRGRRQGRHP